MRKLFTNIWCRGKSDLVLSTKARTLEAPFHSFDEFEVGDLVTTKPGVSPGGRTSAPVSEVGPMMFCGIVQPAIRVMGLPYAPDELIIVKKKPKVNGTIRGLWA